MNNLPECLEEILARLEKLELRVIALENRIDLGEPLGAPKSPGPAMMPIRLPEVPEAGNLLPVLGRAMLGFAGAYALRALTASTPVLSWPASVVAIAYAFGWLAISAHTRITAAYAKGIYAATAAIILIPMLWELTVRFGLLAPPATASALAAFSCFAVALTWRSRDESVLLITQATAAIAAFALFLGTHAVLPFICALVIQFAVCEFAATRGRGTAVRPIVMLVVDLVVAALIFIYQGPASTREDYPLLGSPALIAPATLLFLVEAGGVVARTALLRRRISIVEIIQSMIAYGLAAGAFLAFSPHLAMLVLGSSTLILSAGCYTLAFALFRAMTPQRNFTVFATWAGVFFVIGILLTLPPVWSILCLVCASLVAASVALRHDHFTLEIHAGLFLLTAAFVSGLPHFVTASLTGSALPMLSWRVLVPSACTLAFYATLRRDASEGAPRLVLHFLVLLLSVSTATALLVQSELKVAALFLIPDIFHIAFLRTLAICAVGLALASAGRRWHRVELSSMAYVALVFEAAKLLFEDLRHGHLAFIAASFLVFAVALIGIPSAAHQRHKASAA